jgi:hypothetical protein
LLIVGDGDLLIVGAGWQAYGSRLYAWLTQPASSHVSENVPFMVNQPESSSCIASLM